MIWRTFKLIALLSAVLVLQGCRLAIIVVEGGEVQSTGSGVCIANSICIVDVSDPTFSETFTAVPDDGWYFKKWNSGDGFFCGGSVIPTCHLSFDDYEYILGAPIEDSEEVAKMIASSEMFYLMPIFSSSPRVITDTVTVNGREWAQVDLFAGLSWNDVNAVCPAGACSGHLKGYDMTGWIWASIDDLNALFNHYIGSDLLGPGPDQLNMFNSVWAPAFFADGWRPNSTQRAGDIIVRGLGGLLRDRITEPGDEEAAAGGISECTHCLDGDSAGTNGDLSPDLKVNGAWFYRNSWYDSK